MYGMNRRFAAWAACAVVLIAGSSVQAQEENDEKVPLDKVPAVVKDGVKAKFPKAKILSAQKGDVDGTKVFEFMLKEGKKEWEVAFTPDGKFHSSEELITEAELPAVVKDAFRKKYGDVKLVKLEKETTGEGAKAKVIYEIFFEKGTDVFEAEYDQSGKFITEIKVPPAKKKETKKEKTNK
jgi:hypothetical protein